MNPSAWGDTACKLSVRFIEPQRTAVATGYFSGYVASVSWIGVSRIQYRVPRELNQINDMCRYQSEDLSFFTLSIHNIAKPRLVYQTSLPGKTRWWWWWRTDQLVLILANRSIWDNKEVSKGRTYQLTLSKPRVIKPCFLCNLKNAWCNLKNAWPSWSHPGN
jgi:hypothetical protein